ncbi:DUF3649 domain-containing protein [Oceanibaculum nanhaiense]|uniref:DUF3649 domain-containing protein n=1 Tax=Oceanibaculum nanhaiense TaxID=1909734 RepID=UPI00396E9801
MAKNIAGTSHRIDVAARAVLGIFGSYLLAALLALWAERLLPFEPRAAMLTANMLFFLFYALAAMWAFAAATPRRAWAVIAVPCVLLGGAWLALGEAA